MVSILSPNVKTDKSTWDCITDNEMPRCSDVTGFEPTSPPLMVLSQHLGSVHCTVGRFYWAWGHRKNIYCQKIFGTSFSFQATEMVLTSKWGRIQPKIQIWPDQVVAASWTLVRSPKHAEKMLIQLRSPTEPSWPAVQCWTPPLPISCRVKILIP